MVVNLVGLEISVPVLLWTIINFFILMFLLNKFLFKPIIKVMDQRRAKIEEGLKAGEDANKAMEENEKKLEEELAASAGEARQIIAEARSESDKEKSKVLEETHKQVSEMRKEVKEHIDAEETTARDTLKEEIPDLVSVLTNKLLNTEETSKESELIQKCLEEGQE